MGIRGPQSAAAVLTPTVADLRGDARPEPPADLTEEQAAEWRAVVDRLPADWFPRETHGLLAQDIRHIATARRVARLIAEMDARLRSTSAITPEGPRAREPRRAILIFGRKNGGAY